MISCYWNCKFSSRIGTMQVLIHSAYFCAPLLRQLASTTSCHDGCTTRSAHWWHSTVRNTRWTTRDDIKLSHLTLLKVWKGIVIKLIMRQSRKFMESEWLYMRSNLFPSSLENSCWVRHLTLEEGFRLTWRFYSQICLISKCRYLIHI